MNDISQMIPTLIVPDVHEQWERARDVVAGARAKYPGLPIVFIGDMFDSFYGHYPETIELYLEWLADPDITVLLGNHDIHYLSDNPNYRCSGYSFMYHDKFQELPGYENIIKQVKLATTVHGWLVSHAGVCLGWVRQTFRNKLTDVKSSEDWANQLNSMLQSQVSSSRSQNTPGSLFDCDDVRAGRHPFGGPLWCDWSRLMQGPQPGLKQIVGHSTRPQVQYYGSDLVNIDTNLEHLLFVTQADMFTIPFAEVIKWNSR